MINAKVAESKDETKDLGNELAHCGMQFNMVVYRPPLSTQALYFDCGT